ncbi:ComEA family DNA-binding protein [Mucilaginibacter auburnensis]|uniref:Competence ComEA-like helix-hairpin-helix protein n=1 Tax=Mucilaginibacter auburnensis TaxID=1457233 RepID=A0A2H9VTJ7_9SPHI|nr:helix-hairpin-helix domain-containing protein [Mucilaginibacter auburnensis]PJJ84119.1 competence ComEA-like helix-hairpin-helix protein [Mucilaginibacter auburnensis]
MRQRLIQYFSITKKEWNGTIILLIVILIVLALPYAYQHFHKDKLINFKDFDKAVAALENKDNKAFKKSGNANNASLYPYTSNKLKPGETIDINKADSATFTRVHGVGPSFARRIVLYRKRLGGFVNMEQLKEVYGLDADKYKEISDELRLDPYKPKPIPINKVEFDELRHFPYLSYKQANAVIQYRAQHGNYNSVDDMRDIVLLNDEILRKIAPYISFK